MTVQHLPCPTCGRQTPVSLAKYLPFCSDRCRLIDLGRWLDEEHVLPVAAADDEEEDVDHVNSDRARHWDAGDMDSERSEQLRPPVRLPPGWHDA
ncbi:MAG: DNA gyrase inhibitor YacG [Pirellulaceae bacterium]|nr:DNA gyrase inhibitor YacG [Pirellulaceae bacterium]